MSATTDRPARAQVIASWTGGDADLLRQSLRMTNESFAEYLGVAVRTVACWRKLLSQVLPLHQRVRSLLGGRLRLSQQRELYRIESLLLSHACLLLGDLNQNDRAERYGMAGLAFAREAGSDQSVAMTVLAKTF